MRAGSPARRKISIKPFGFKSAIHITKFIPLLSHLLGLETMKALNKWKFAYSRGFRFDDKKRDCKGNGRWSISGIDSGGCRRDILLHHGAGRAHNHLDQRPNERLIEHQLSNGKCYLTEGSCRWLPSKWAASRGMG